MVAVILIALGVGAFLGLRFKVWLLLVAVATTVLVGRFVDFGPLSSIFGIILSATGLQIGYVIGAYYAPRSIPESELPNLARTR